jgi:hypothetical protein
MERKTETGVERLIGWIDEKFAKVGKKLKFQDDDQDTWELGWVVTTIGDRQTRSERQERSQDYKRQRKGSDI